MTPCGFSTSACRISSTRVADSGLGSQVGAQPLRHRRDHLERQAVVPFDGIAELSMAEHHGFGRPVGTHRRGRGSPVQHSNLAEELTGAEPGRRLAGARDLHMTTLEDVEGFGRLPLADQCLTRLETELVHATGDELEVAFRDFREERHTSQPIDLRIRHVGNTTPTYACGTMSGTAGAGTWRRSISTTRWRQGAKQSVATPGGRHSS